MDTEFTGQLIDSMTDAVSKLEIVVRKKRNEEANKLKIFIFDLHKQIAESLK